MSGSGKRDRPVRPDPRRAPQRHRRRPLRSGPEPGVLCSGPARARAAAASSATASRRAPRDPGRHSRQAVADPGGARVAVEGRRGAVRPGPPRSGSRRKAPAAPATPASRSSASSGAPGPRSPSRTARTYAPPAASAALEAVLRVHHVERARASGSPRRRPPGRGSPRWCARAATRTSCATGPPRAPSRAARSAGAGVSRTLRPGTSSSAIPPAPRRSSSPRTLPIRMPQRAQRAPAQLDPVPAGLQLDRPLAPAVLGQLHRRGVPRASACGYEPSVPTRAAAGEAQLEPALVRVRFLSASHEVSGRRPRRRRAGTGEDRLARLGRRFEPPQAGVERDRAAGRSPRGRTARRSASPARSGPRARASARSAAAGGRS